MLLRSLSPLSKCHLFCQLLNPNILKSILYCPLALTAHIPSVPIQTLCFEIYLELNHPSPPPPWQSQLTGPLILPMSHRAWACTADRAIFNKRLPDHISSFFKSSDIFTSHSVLTMAFGVLCDLCLLSLSDFTSGCFPSW